MESNGVIQLNVSSETVKTLLSYLYTGELSVPTTLHTEFTTLANILELPPLVVACERMRLESELESENDKSCLKKNKDKDIDQVNELRESQIDLKAIWGESDSDSDDDKDADLIRDNDIGNKGESENISSALDTSDEIGRETSATDISEDNTSARDTATVMSDIEHTEVLDKPEHSENMAPEIKEVDDDIGKSVTKCELDENGSLSFIDQNIELDIPVNENEMIPMDDSFLHDDKDKHINSAEFVDGKDKHIASVKREHVSTNETPCAKRQKIIPRIDNPLNLKPSPNCTNTANILPNHSHTQNETFTSICEMEASTCDASGVDLFASPSPVKQSNPKTRGSNSMETVSVDNKSMLTGSIMNGNETLSKTGIVHCFTPAEDDIFKNGKRFDSRMSNIHPIDPTKADKECEYDFNTTVDELNIDNSMRPNEKVNLKMSDAVSKINESKPDVDKMEVSTATDDDVDNDDDDLVIVDDNLEEINLSQTSSLRKTEECRSKSYGSDKTLGTSCKTCKGADMVDSIVIDHHEESSMDSLPSIEASQTNQSVNNNIEGTDACVSIDIDEYANVENNTSPELLDADLNVEDHIEAKVMRIPILSPSDTENDQLVLIDDEENEGSENGTADAHIDEDCPSNGSDGDLESDEGAVLFSGNDTNSRMEAEDQMNQSLPQDKPEVWEGFHDCDVEFEPPASSPPCEPLTQSVYISSSVESDDSMCLADDDKAGMDEILDLSLLQDGDDSFVFKVNVAISAPAQESKIDEKVVPSCYKTPSVRRDKVARGKHKPWVPPSPFTPMPEYQTMATPNLKNEVKKYGVKPVGKKRMVKLLEDIYKQTHQYETDSDCDESPETDFIETLKSNQTTSSAQPATKLSRKGSVSSSELKSKDPVSKTSNKGSVSSSDLKTKKTVSKITKKGSVSRSEDKMKKPVCVSPDKGLAARLGFKMFPTASETAVSENSVSQGSEDSSGDTDGSDMLEESCLHVAVSDSDTISPQSSPQKGADLPQKLMNFIMSNEELHVRILMYEPLELDVLKKTIREAGIKCSMDKLMDFLDERCIAFTSKNTRKQPTCRGRGRKHAKSQVKPTSETGS